MAAITPVQTFDTNPELWIKAYSAESKLEELSPEAKILIEKTLRRLPLDATPLIKYKFSQTLSFVNRTTHSGIFNLGATCWFNTLCQSLYIPEGPHKEELSIRLTALKAQNAELQSRIKALESQDTDATDAAERGALRELNQTVEKNETNINRIQSFTSILEMAREGLPDDLEGRVAFNTLFSEIIESFFSEFEAFNASEGYDDFHRFRHQDLFEGISRLQAFLGLANHPETIDQTQLRVRDHYQALKGNHTRFSRDSELVAFSPVPTKFGSTSNGLRQHFMHPEVMSDSEQVEFDKAGKLDAVKTTFHVLPDGKQAPLSLMVQNLRFNFDRKTLSYTKCEDPVECSDQIVMPFYDVTGEKVEKLVKYILDGVICHLGKEAGSGHYVFYKKTKDGFTCYNDELVYKVAERFLPKVLNTIRQNGFMALYQRDKVWSGSALDCDSVRGYPTLKSEVGKVFTRLSAPAKTAPAKTAPPKTARTKPPKAVKTAPVRTLAQPTPNYDAKIYIAAAMLAAVIAYLFALTMSKKD